MRGVLGEKPYLIYIGRFNDSGRVSNSNPYIFVDEENHTFYGKCHTEDKPYIIANEYLTSILAKLIGLQIPQSGLTKYYDKDLFLSKEVTLPTLRDSGYPKPHFHTDRFRRDVAHMIVFDCWIMNRDRHDANVLVDPSNDYAITLIDHDCSLFNWGMDSRKLTQKHDMEPQWTSHDFIRSKLLPNCTVIHSDVNSFAREIALLGNNLLEDDFRKSCENVITSQDADTLIEVLLKRKQNLPHLMQQYMNEVSLRHCFQTQAPS